MMETFRFTFELSNEIYLFKVTQVFEIECNYKKYIELRDMCDRTVEEYREFLKEREPGEFLCLLDTYYGENLIEYFKFEKDIFQKVIIGFSDYKIEQGSLPLIHKKK